MKNNNNKKFDIMKVVPKAVFIGTFIMACLFVVYALAFSTPFFGLSYYTDGLMHVPSAEIYKNIQPFNRALLNKSLIQILFVAAMFIFFCQKRRIYYLSNYITIAAYAVYSLYVSIYTLSNIIAIRAEYDLLDVEAVNFFGELRGEIYEKSYAILNIGVVLFVLAVIVAAAAVFVAVNKFVSRRKELMQKIQKDVLPKEYETDAKA